MNQLTLNYPEGLEHVVQLTTAELEPHIRLMAALKMFELGSLSSGKAAELAGLSKRDFLDVCGNYHVSPYNYMPDELASEIHADAHAPGVKQV